MNEKIGVRLCELLAAVATPALLALLAGLSGAALAVDVQKREPMMTTKPPPSSAKLFRKACPDMTYGFATTQRDGGTLNAPQGWLFKAEVQNAPNGQAYLICQYGRHKREDLRASNPVYEVSYLLSGYRAEQCTAQGAGVTCSK